MDSVVHVCDPNNAKARGLVQVHGQPELQSEVQGSLSILHTLTVSSEFPPNFAFISWFIY